MVGVKRGALQKKIKQGELSSFEGMISLTELLRTYPATRIEDDTMLERVERIKEDAVTKAIEDRIILPDAGVLATRVTTLSRELARAKSELNRYSALFDGLKRKLKDFGQDREPHMRAAATALTSWLKEELRKQSEHAEFPEELLVRDTLLRVVAAHVRILPSQHDFFVEGSDNLLEAALRSGLGLNYGCTDGSCGLCKAKIVSGDVKQIRPHKYVFSDAEKESGHILMCCNTPVADLVLEAQEAGGVEDIPMQRIAAQVKKLVWPTENIAVLELRTLSAQRLRFLAGQYATLQVADMPGERYSVASCPCEETLQFHIRKVEGHPFTDYVSSSLKDADAVAVQGPIGDFVFRGDSPRSLIFVAGDTGFAPIKSLIEHAMALDVAESMHLYWVAFGSGEHYLHNLCRSWSDALDNFHYTPVTVPGGGQTQLGADARRLRESDVQAVFDGIADDHPDSSEYDYYVAGSDPVITAARNFVQQRGIPQTQCFTERIG